MRSIAPTTISRGCAALGLVLICGPLALVGSGDALAAIAHSSSAPGAWSTPKLVPGIVALDHTRFNSAAVTTVSCPARNWCGAGGTYGDVHGNSQAFVVVGGPDAGGLAREVPGLAMLNHGSASLTSLSCASPGNCSAGGSYQDASLTTTAYVVNEVHGAWQRAHSLVESPTGEVSDITALSCTAPGDCSAVGDDASNLAVVTSEVNGTWGPASIVPGLSVLGTTGSLTSISCASPGDCSAGGSVGNSTIPENPQPLVVNQVGGTWGSAREIPGVAALNVGDMAAVTSLSCGAPGNCSAGGYYTDAKAAQQLFVATEHHHTWQAGHELPGLQALNGGGFATLASLSCRGAGACAAVGRASVHMGSGSLYVSEGIVAVESAGAWHAARIVPGRVDLQSSALTSVSCGTPTACTVVGYTVSGATQPVAADESNGVWQALHPTSGPQQQTAASHAGPLVVACATALSCVAGGWIPSSIRTEAMLMAERPRAPAPEISHLTPASGPARGGTVVVVYGTHLDGATSVRFGAKPGSDVHVIDPDALRVTSPPGVDTVEVRVTTASGTTQTGSHTRFTYG